MIIECIGFVAFFASLIVFYFASTFANQTDENLAESIKLLNEAKDLHDRVSAMLKPKEGA